MKSSNDTVATPMDTIVAPPSAAPKEPRTKTITLTSGDTTLQLVAERTPTGARTYALVLDPASKNSRGLSVQHESWAGALASLVVNSTKAQAKGWIPKSPARGFIAAPDAFSSIPGVPKAAPKAKK